jgi:hypothetical protein
VKPEEMDFSAAVWFNDEDRRIEEEEASKPVEKLSITQKVVRGIIG